MLGKNSSFSLLLLLVIIAVWRVVVASIPALFFFSNFSALGGIALFGGAYFKGYKSFLFPLLVLFITDIYINSFIVYHHFTIFRLEEIWVYIAFALMVLVGKWGRPQKSISHIILSCIGIVFIHWIVADIGVWLSGITYPLTWAGWLACLTAAIPFEKNFLLGTIVSTSILFSVGRMVTIRSMQLHPQTM